MSRRRRPCVLSCGARGMTAPARQQRRALRWSARKRPLRPPELSWAMPSAPAGLRRSALPRRMQRAPGAHACAWLNLSGSEETGAGTYKGGMFVSTHGDSDS